MTVLITGGATGIGKAICEIFAKNGYDLAINYYKSEKEALLLKKELQDMYKGKIELFKYNLASLDNVSNLYHEFKQAYPKGADVLVNNAGICEDKLFQDLDDDKINEIYNVNLLSAIKLTRLVISDMISKKSGTIINISSISGVLGCSYEVDYSTTKAALNGFTKALSKEVGKSNITVNAIAPGIIKTEMTKDLDEEYCKQCIPLNRYGTTKEVADLVYHLSQNKYITGQIIGIDGAMIL
ncbi:MAG: SDR family NAD(P)-dependent oxidoreductase [Clostridia bacterium]|nr:SDR family NAD(P)-dependent oxidoreductase [Clostridia bacterium]